MASLTFFQPFRANLANGKHNLAANQLAVALTNTAPTAGMNALSELTQISYTNLSSRNVTTTSSTQTGGAYSLVTADLTLTAAGTVPAFQYVVLYNTVPTGFELIGWYDRGSAVNMIANDTFLVDFGATTLTM